MPDTQPTIEERLQVIADQLHEHLLWHHYYEEAGDVCAAWVAPLTVRLQSLRRDADCRIGQLEDKVRAAERRR